MSKFLDKINEYIAKIALWFNGRASNSVDYISELPSPLSPQEESELLDAMKEGDDGAREKLIEHNLRLVVYIAKRFDNTGHDMDELVSVGTMGLIKAVKSFSRDKNIKLATFASRCIENEILMFLRKMVKVKHEVSLEEPLNVDYEGNQLVLSDILGSDPEQLYKSLETSAELAVLRELFAALGERDRRIIAMRYGLYGEEERTQKEIADMMCISQSYISRLEKRILVEMREGFAKIE